MRWYEYVDSAVRGDECVIQQEETFNCETVAFSFYRLYKIVCTAVDIRGQLYTAKFRPVIYVWLKVSHRRRDGVRLNISART